MDTIVFLSPIGVASTVTVNSNTMLPTQVLNAIPRQKVKDKSSGRIGDVVQCDLDNEWVTVLCDGRVCAWFIADCEPVPEEPRPLRVGDAMYNSFCGFFRAIAVKDETEVLLPNGNWAHNAFVRLATPQELKDYFLND